MNDDAFRTRLRWSAARLQGVAKLHGACVALQDVPKLDGCLQMAEIDYVPEVGGYRIRDYAGGWRDMEDHEVKAADAFLRKVVFRDN